MMEFLVAIEVRFPADMSEKERAAISEQEAGRGRELRTERVIERIWRIPGRRANVGIWRAQTADELHTKLMSLPAFPWLDVQVTALATHPLENTTAP